MKVLLLGGSKSGKSILAQSLCRRLAAGGLMYYWATMEPHDDEDLARIARHLADRAGWGFRTVECGRTLPAALPQVSPSGTVLFDSVTALLSNEMFGAEIDAAAPARAAQELLQISRSVRHFVCVCDDIFRDAGHYDEWTERYRAGLAAICRTLAPEFDTVAEVAAGLPICHKGVLP